MENSIRYYKYLLRKSLLQIIIAFVIIGVYVYAGSLQLSFSYYTEDYTYRFVSETAIIALIFAGLVFVFDELRSLNNRRNLDLWYSLPLTRTQLIVTKYLAGLTKCFVLYIESMIIWAILLIAAPRGISADFTKLPALMLFAFVAVLLFYTFAFAIFSFANSDRDGIIFVIGHALIYSTLWDRIINNYHLFIAGDYEEWRHSYYDRISINIFEFISEVAAYFNNSLIIQSKGEATAWDKVFDNTALNEKFPAFETVGTLIYLGVAVLFLIIAILYSKRRDASKVESVSQTWFGYKTLIPLYALCFCFDIPTLTLMDIFIVFSTVVYITCLFIAYIFYRRSIKFKKLDYLVFAILIAIKIIMNIVYIGMEDQLFYY